MRIAFFLPNLADGGAERIQVGLASSFADRGHEVYLVVGTRDGPAGRHLAPTVRVVDLKKPRLFRSIFALARFIRSEKPDIVLSALSHANLVAILAKLLTPSSKTKLIVKECSPLWARASFQTSRMDRAIPHLIRLFYPLADMVLGVSRGVAQEIGEWARLRPHRIGFIYNPNFTSRAAVSGCDPDHERLMDGLEGPVVMAAGRLMPVKDLGVLIRAFAPLAEELQANLIILGEGPSRSELEAIASSLGIADSVIFLGYVDDPVAYMARANAFALSSRYEGLANVLVEALSCGLPVVSTDCPFGPREVLADGRFGRLVPVGDVEALHKGLFAALTEPNDSAPLRARAQDFSPDRIVDRYVDLFRGLLGLEGRIPGPTSGPDVSS